MVAIERADAICLELRQAAANGDKVRVHQFDKRASQEEIEANEGEERRRVVKLRAGGFLDFAALFDEVGLQDFTQAAEFPQRFNHLVERFAECRSLRCDFSQDGAQDLGYIRLLDLLVVDLRRRAKSEILDEEEINFVAIDVAFRRLAKVPVNQSREAGF